MSAEPGCVRTTADLARVRKAVAEQVRQGVGHPYLSYADGVIAALDYVEGVTHLNPVERLGPRTELPPLP